MKLLSKPIDWLNQVSRIHGLDVLTKKMATLCLITTFTYERKQVFRVSRMDGWDYRSEDLLFKPETWCNEIMRGSDVIFLILGTDKKILEKFQQRETQEKSNIDSHSNIVKQIRIVISKTNTHTHAYFAQSERKKILINTHTNNGVRFTSLCTKCRLSIWVNLNVYWIKKEKNLNISSCFFSAFLCVFYNSVNEKGKSRIKIVGECCVGPLILAKLIWVRPI